MYRVCTAAHVSPSTTRTVRVCCLVWWQFAEASSVDAILALIPGELSLFIVVLFWKIELIYCHSYVLFLLHRFVFQLLITALIDAKDP